MCRWIRGRVPTAIIQRSPSLNWVQDECANTLDMVVNPRPGTSASSISDLLNKLFELSTITDVLHPAGSVRAVKANEHAIPNPCVSCYWATTTSNATKIVSESFVASGLGSRTLISFHRGAAGEVARRLIEARYSHPDRRSTVEGVSNDPRRPQDSHQYNMLASLGQVITPEIVSMIVTVRMTPDAFAISEKFRKASDAFKYAVQNETSRFPRPT